MWKVSSCLKGLAHQQVLVMVVKKMLPAALKRDFFVFLLLKYYQTKLF